MKITKKQLRKIIREELSKNSALILEGTPAQDDIAGLSTNFELLDTWFSLKGISGPYSSYADGVGSGSPPPYYGWFKFIT